MLPSGWLGDRLGPRRFLALIVALLVAVHAVNRPGFGGPVLIAVRLLFGAAEAGAYPTAARAIYNWLPARERGLALGLLNTGSRLGAAFGLAVMSVSVASFGWRVSFVALGIGGVLWAAWWYVWFRDRPRAQGRRFVGRVAEARPPDATGVRWSLTAV